MDREHVGEDVIEDERLLADDRIAREESEDAIAVGESREIGREAREARTVRRQITELIKLNYGRQ